jgi:glycogen debranching enzyme
VTVAADLTDSVVLKTGNAFLVTTPGGGMPLAGFHAFGFYRDDCRFVCGHELRVGGARPRLLVADAASASGAVHELTNEDLALADGRTLAIQSLRIRVERVLAGEAELRERVDLHLYGREPVAGLEVEVALAADFRPVLVLHGIVDIPAPAVTTETVAGGVRLSARGSDGVMRAVTVTADPAPVRVADGRLRFAVDLEPGGSAGIELAYAPHEGEELSGARVAVEAPGARAPARGPSPGGPRIRTDDELFNRILDRSLLDLEMLRSRIDGRSYYAAGVPWYATLFGRDSLIAALQTLALDADVAADTLRLLAGRLGAVSEPLHEEEPGKVLHELRLGEAGAPGVTPFSRYYGTVDATPLFLCLLCDHADWSGSLDLFGELDFAVDAALRWIDEYADHDGDGLIDYAPAAPGGLRNHGWKDSADGVPDGRGAPLEPPIALIEAQGYVVRAKRGLAALFDRAGDGARAAALAHEAEELQSRLERFWLADRGFYAMAVDREGEPSPVFASNQGYLLWAGAVPRERAEAVRDVLMGDALNSGWGIRTLARGEPAFNPVSYHRGSVWPHDTALIAAGLRRYGFTAELTALFDATLDAASHADGYRLPELFAGFGRTELAVPVPYPVACRPQAWAAGAIPFLLTTALGLRADALARRLIVERPALPRRVHRVEITGLPVGGARVDLLFERTRGTGHVAVSDARVDGDLEIVLRTGDEAHGGPAP